MKKYGFLMKFSLLSISLILTSAPAISGSIPALSEQFSSQSQTMIELVSMLPTIFLAVFVLVAIPVSERIGDKNTVLLGLILSLIGGVAPVFVNNFWLILFFRALLGAGLGLFNSICFELISDFFSGDERTKMLGYQSSFQGLGGALLTFLAGQLLVFGWHAPFWVYSITLPILVLFYFFVPKDSKRKQPHEKLSFNKAIIKYALINFAVTVIYNAIAIRLPDLFVTEKIADASMASTVYAICQIATMLTGFVYLYLSRAFGKLTLPVSITLMAAGFCMIAFGNALWIMFIGSVCIGCAFAMQVPFLFNRASDISTPSQNLLSSTALIISGQSAGFFAPFVLGPLGNIPFLSNAYAQSFLSGAVVLLVLAGLVWFLQLKKKAGTF